ncbi:hypothetical protein [Haloimpatiens massiliensis]|uniref:hypothetical protein n=1 Tax=Haloimpatiens massiliensis TaxID=1658110 RepID=UPI000C86538E|nr:hypothetical protein [Haloimpatiens massiliensis]
MGMIGDIINNKVAKIKKDKFLENISNLIQDADMHKSELYRLNNRLKNELLNCTKLNGILNINTDFGSIPWRLTEKIDENSIGYSTNFRDIGEVDTLCKENINKFNNIVSYISQYCKKISQYNDVIEDIRCYMEEQEKPVSTNSIIKFGINKNNDLFCLLCDFGKQKITEIRHLEVDIFYGKFHQKKDYYHGKGFMQLGVGIVSCHPSIEIKAIDIRTKEKCTGLGSFTLKWLEEVIIPKLNRQIDKFNSEPKSEEEDIELYHIKYIYGCSGDLSSDTDSEARKRFYTKNGYTIDGKIFRKALK